MKEHQLCLKHLETKGPTTHVAFVGAVAAAVHASLLGMKIEETMQEGQHIQPKWKASKS